METKEIKLELGTEFNRGDDLNISYTRNFEYLFEDFEISDGVILPVGGYEFDRLSMRYRLGPQRRVSGWIRGSTGNFFSGTCTEVGYFGRVEVTPQFTVEPNISQNWVNLAEGDFVTTLLRVRSTYALSARSFVGVCCCSSTRRTTRFR